MKQSTLQAVNVALAQFAASLGQILAADATPATTGADTQVTAAEVAAEDPDVSALFVNPPPATGKAGKRTMADILARRPAIKASARPRLTMEQASDSVKKAAAVASAAAAQVVAPVKRKSFAELMAPRTLKAVPKAPIAADKPGLTAPAAPAPAPSKVTTAAGDAVATGGTAKAAAASAPAT